jgi:hypothetical protein
MANEKRSRKSKDLRYFFLNGELHKKLHVNKSSDVITAWNYDQAKRIGYSLSDAKKNLQQAYTINEAAALLNRHRNRILEYIEKGFITRPKMTYTLDSKKKPVKYLMSEDDVMMVREFLSTLHRGRPRKDGLITSKNVPTKQELRAKIKNEVVLYQQTDDGEFIPVWKQPEW